MALRGPAIHRSRIGIVTDSAACLPAEVAGELGIAVVPLALAIGATEYRDGAGPARAEFYRRLRNERTPPRTAAPSPGALLAGFRSLGTSEVVCLTVAAVYSATHANASLAAARAAAEGLVVRVVDSETAAAAEGYVVRAAAESAIAGAAIDAVVAAAERARNEVGLLMLIESLDYLARGGRVPRVAAWASGLLRVRPIVELRQGRVRLAGRAQSRRRGLETMVGLLASRSLAGGHLYLTVQHADAPADAELLATLAGERLRPAALEVSEFTQVMTTHVGPGLVGFAYRLKT